MTVVRIKGYIRSISRSIWADPIQLQRIHGEYMVSNGFGGLGVFDSRTKTLLGLYIPLCRSVEIKWVSFDGYAHCVEIKIFFF